MDSLEMISLRRLEVTHPKKSYKPYCQRKLYQYRGKRDLNLQTDNMDLKNGILVFYNMVDNI